MKNKSIIIVLAMLILGLMHVLIPSPVYACSCGRGATAKQVMEHSDVVFLGRVISITETTPAPPSDYGPFTGIAVLFDVITLYKGEQKAQYVVYTGTGRGDCGVIFTVGETRLVFASEGDDQLLGTGICRYFRSQGAPPDEEVLGEGIPLAEQPELTPNTSNAPVAEWRAVVIMA
jgi:Tissue inhibitor of metalloproteinase